jgi:hypothetical protein
MPENAIVNTKAIYAVGGGIAVAAIAIFFVMGQANFSFTGGQNVQNPTTAVQNQSTVPLELTLKNIIVNKTNDKDASVQTIFNVSNPGKNTITLETVQYSLYVGQFKMALGGIGKSPEGFVAGQEDTFPIVPGSAITLRDTQVAERNNLTANSWNSMVNGTAHYRVEGLYSYRSTGTNFQTGFFEKQFNVTFS